MDHRRAYEGSPPMQPTIRSSELSRDVSGRPYQSFEPLGQIRMVMQVIQRARSVLKEPLVSSDWYSKLVRSLYQPKVTLEV